MPWYTKILGKVVSKGSKAKPIVKTSKKLIGSADDVKRVTSQGAKRINSVHGDGYANAGHVPHPSAGNVKPATTAHVPTTSSTTAARRTAYTPTTPSRTPSSGIKITEYDTRKFKFIEADPPTEIKRLVADDIGLSVRGGGYRAEVGNLSKIKATDFRECGTAEYYKGLENAESWKACRFYDSENNTTAIAFKVFDNETAFDAIYIPGKISQADAQEIYKIITKNHYKLRFDGQELIKESNKIEQWKATQAEIAEFLNNGGKKAIKPAETPASAHIIPEQPVVIERTNLGQPAITSTGTGHVPPASTHIPTTPSSAAGTGSVVNPARTEFTAAGTAARTPNPVPALDKPFLNETEIKIIKDNIPNERISNAVQTGFEELGIRLKNGEKMSENLLYDVARSVSAKTGVQDGTIMRFMKTNMHKFGGKWQILEWNQTGRMNEFWATR